MQKKIIISIITFVIFLIFAASTLYVSLAVLQPSIKLGSGYKETSCLVTGSNTESTCNNLKCTSQNTDVWWYNSWGGSYFFIYVSGGSGNSDYSDDGGGDDDDDGGDDNEDGGDDDNEDSGTSDDGDSGGSSGGDSGGFSSDSGGGDDMKRSRQSLTTGSAEFVGYQSQEIKDKKLENKLKKLNNNKSASLVGDNNSTGVATTGTTGTPPMSSGSSNYASSASGCNTCYQGTFLVSYIVGNGSLASSSIEGLVSSDFTWVSGYLANYANNSYYTCYYQQDTIENVIWFKPPLYSKSSLVGTIILSIVSLIFLIVSLALLFSGIKDAQHHSHHHHNNKHHTGAGKYKSINNSGSSNVVATAAPISAKKGYQSYHKTNGSYHGGYEVPTPIYASNTAVAAPAPAPYYQYNQGIAQIDFSNNNNKNINFVQPPQYGN